MQGFDETIENKNLNYIDKEHDINEVECCNSRFSYKDNTIEQKYYIKKDFLSTLNLPQDIKELTIEELNELSSEIREYLISLVSKTGGHIASNLGVVELTLALHRVFNFPEDKIVWDVGHQTYIHKMITGRLDKMETLRQMNGLSGFPKRCESVYDCFNTGHSSTSISAALGMAKARDLKGENNNVIAVIGDGALTGGMAFEALNDAGHSRTRLIVILNDNGMSISKNVGGLSRYLNKIRTRPLYYKVKDDISVFLDKFDKFGDQAKKTFQKIRDSLKYLVVPGTLFDELGFKYYGPIDGHNVNDMVQVLNSIKNIKDPVIIHVLTKKGKGYSFAEENPNKFHGIAPFDINTGNTIKKSENNFSKVFGNKMVELAKENERLVAISAAMPDGTGLANFMETYPKRFFDVGIAEQHALTFAAGLACEGFKPVTAIYSSFVQRAYDQIIHDVALQNLDVVIALDRAGVVGDDGETHHGIYDISYLNTVPNMSIMVPCDYTELEQMLEYDVNEHCGPIAIRYPRGGGSQSLHDAQLEFGKAVKIKEGTDISLIAVGPFVEHAIVAAERLSKQGYSCEVINARFVKPIDERAILDTCKKTGKVITIEDNIISGGFGSVVSSLISSKGISCKMKMLGYPDEKISHATQKQLYRIYSLDAQGIYENALKLLVME